MGSALFLPQPGFAESDPVRDQDCLESVTDDINLLTDNFSTISPEKDLSQSVLAITEALENLDFDSAVKQLGEIESSTHPSVLLLQAFCHEMGIGTVIDSNRARQSAMQAAAMEDWEAAQFLAWHSITGYSGDPNLLEAEEWRNKLSIWKNSNPHPPVLPENILVPQKNGYVPRYELVSPWIQKKALGMDPVAQFNLYKILIDGRSTLPNINGAMGWLQKSAEGGYAAAAKMMAFYYEHGFILKKNESMQARFLQVAADSADADAQYKLAMLLIHPRSIQKDVTKAVELLEKAVSQNHMNAIHELAELNYYGNEIEENRARAYVLYTKAAQMGHADAMYNKGWMLTYGQGVDEDKQKGIKAFTEAVQLGSGSAAVRLAKIYLYGWGTKGDPERAKSFANKAIELGNENGRRMLAEYYYRGYPEHPDYENALKNYELCAREGDEECQYMMGELLFLGRGIGRDLEEALRWYRLAASKGHRKARSRALKMEGFGWGTKQDTEKLVTFFRESLLNMEDIVEQNTAEILQRLQNEQVDPGSSKEKLLVALQMVDQPDKKEFVRQEIINYRVNWFRENVISKFDQLNTGESPEELSEREWAALADSELNKRLQSGERHPPKPISQPAPVYPPGLRIFSIEETVSLNLKIGVDGRIDEHSYNSVPLPQFKQSIEQMLPHWRFIPASSQGKFVPANVRISIPFRVKRD